MPHEPEPRPADDQAVIAVDIETLIAEETLLPSEPVVLTGQQFRIVRQDEGLDVDGPTGNLQRLGLKFLGCLVGPVERVPGLDFLAV